MNLFETIEVKPINEEYYKVALTHTSYANENNVTSYERLEYLGDAILELVMSDYLYKNTDYKEGVMTKKRAEYVCEDALFSYSMKLGLNKFLYLGHGEEENGGRQRKAIVADIFESIIGAIYLDKGYEEAKDFIYKNAVEHIKNEDILFMDYKSTLQEYVQTDKRSLEYIVINESGPAHNKTFEVVAKIDDVIYGHGIAHSKKEAEQKAACDALLKAQKA